MEKKNRLKQLNMRISRQSQTVNISLEISPLKTQILSFRSKSSQLSSFKEDNSSIAIGWEGENDRTSQAKEVRYYISGFKNKPFKKNT